jgi:hypothetical protein
MKISRVQYIIFVISLRMWHSIMSRRSSDKNIISRLDPSTVHFIVTSDELISVRCSFFLIFRNVKTLSSASKLSERLCRYWCHYFDDMFLCPFLSFLYYFLLCSMLLLSYLFCISVFHPGWPESHFTEAKLNIFVTARVNWLIFLPVIKACSYFICITTRVERIFLTYHYWLQQQKNNVWWANVHEAR